MEKELTQKEILNLDEETNGVFFPSKFGDKDDIRFDSFEEDNDTLKFQETDNQLSSNGKHYLKSNLRLYI